jgi:hypothetical protein
MTVSDWKAGVLGDPVLGRRGNCPVNPDPLPQTGSGFKRSKHYANPEQLKMKRQLPQLKSGGDEEFFAMSAPSTKIAVS